MFISNQSIIAKAISALSRRGDTPCQASPTSSSVEVVGDQRFAVLRNGFRTLGVYEVTGEGRIKWIEDHPSEFLD